MGRYVTVDVDVDLSDFDTEDLIDELESRGKDYETFETCEVIRQIYEKRRIGKDYQRELDWLIYDVIGRI